MTSRTRDNSMSDRMRTALTTGAVLLVMVISVLVRIPHYTADRADVLLDHAGKPYFSEMDAYFHVRMADEIAENGVYGIAEAESGQRWDPLRYAPDGKPADYHEGIAQVSVAIWRVLRIVSDVDLHTVDYYLSCLFAAVTVPILYWFGKCAAQASGGPPRLTGILSAAMAVCAPAYVERTMAGTFDTDMAQIPLAALLLLLMALTLTSKTCIRAALWAAGMAAVTGAFTLFWSRGLAFAGIAFFAGGVFLIGSLVRVIFGRGHSAEDYGRGHSAEDFGKGHSTEKSAEDWRYLKAACFGYALCLLILLAGLMILQGPSYIRSFLQSVSYVTTEDTVAGMPNRYTSIAEMQSPAFGPEQILPWFIGCLPGGERTIVNGIGGIQIFVAAIIGLGTLIAGMWVPADTEGGVQSAQDAGNGQAEEFHPAVWFWLLFIWFEACLIMAFKGERFIMHLSVPTGILAGTAAGFACSRIRQSRLNSLKYPAMILLGSVLIIPSVACSFTASREYPGLVSDCAENTMDWIAANASPDDALIMSWWDLGYYYEYESGLPVLWDGGSQDEVRAMVVGKALTCTDFTQSRTLLKMLAASGNRVSYRLNGRLGFKDGFDALWKMSSSTKSEAVSIMQDQYGFSAEEAEEIGGMMFPSSVPEIYLVITERMMRILGWIEYYGNWDFSGDVQYPDEASFLSVDPSQQGASDGQDSEVIRQLYFHEDGGRWFRQVFETKDELDTAKVYIIK